jgi:hypothetical protein
MTKEIKEDKQIEHLFYILRIKSDGLATFECSDCKSRLKVEVFF